MERAGRRDDLGELKPRMETTRFINVVHRRELICEEELHPLVGPLFAIETHLTLEERLALLQTARGLPEGFVACEIGSYVGASAAFLSVGARLHGGHVHCVDTWDNRAMPGEEARDTYAEFRRHTEPFRSWLTEHRGLSLEVAAGVPEPLDLLFLDGDHSYEGVRADLAAYGPKLRPGGWLLVHDCHRAEVLKAANEFLAGYTRQQTGLAASLLLVQLA